MNHQVSSVFSKRLSGLAIAWMATSLSGCGPFVTLYANQDKFDQKNDTSMPVLENDPFLKEVADQFGLMALFAEVVYRRDLDAKFKDDESKDGKGCRYLKHQEADASELDFGMPHHPGGRWKRWTPQKALDNGVLPCFDESGLYYETYVYEEAGEIKEAVIAFRGTENRKGQTFQDWRSNIVASFGLEPKEYKLASQFVPVIVEGLKKSGPHVDIYVTGHSLGGGLAQQAGYLSKDIKEVFTFNTSPTTNWSYLRMRGAVKNGYPIFHRVYHGGEFLEKLRFVSSTLTATRYGRNDIGVQFDKKSDFSGHAMKIMTCKFAELIALRQPAVDAKHHYPVQYIRESVLNQNSTLPANLQVCGP